MTDNNKNRQASIQAKLQFAQMAGHLVDIMPLGVVTFDIEFNIIDSNPVASDLLLESDNITQSLGDGCESVNVDNWREKLDKALAAGESYTFENIRYCKGDVSRILQIICTPITDAEGGERMGGSLLIEDVTSKVMMHNDLALSERLASVGKLAARVAHELNNPLDGILRYINLAMRLTDSDQKEKVNQYLVESRKGLLRMVKILSELLEYSRSTYSSFEQADINKIVEDSVKAMEPQALENKVEIIRDYSVDMPNVRSGNLFQVFCNLLKNAVDAMTRGGELKVRTYYDRVNLLVDFMDDGEGMNNETKVKLFEPFYTTKESGKGTGLGLAICKDIVEKYNGGITAENRPEGGCVFSVRIPLDRTSWAN